MTDRHRERADRVVESFKRALDEDVRQRLTRAQLEDLALAIQEAISEELHDAAERVEAVAAELRAESRAERPDMHL